jgi:hypothetical protein
MDAKQIELEARLADLLKQASEVAAHLQAIEQGRGTPHYDQIEIPAHEVGQRLSRLIQSSRAGDVAAEADGHMACPDCGRSCRVASQPRQVLSMDGPVGLIEPVAHCRHCRRSFFPSA